MRIERPISILVVVLQATLACSRDDTPAAKPDASVATTSSRIVSCDRVPATSLCSEYSGTYLTQNEAVLSSTCSKLGGAFVPAECPNTSVLGSCTLSTSEVRKFYGSGGGSYDAAKAETECATSYKGKWSAFH